MDNISKNVKTSDLIIDEFNKYIKYNEMFYKRGSIRSARKTRRALSALIKLSRKARKEILFELTYLNKI